MPDIFDQIAPDDTQGDIFDQVAMQMKPKPTFYSEAIAPILEGGSTAAFGIPRMIARGQYGGQYEKSVFPEQQTVPGKILRGAAETIGFVGGGIGKAATAVGKKLLPKLAQETLKRRALRAALGGATAGALTPPSKGIVNLPERGRQAGVYGVISGGLPLAGRALKQIPKGLTTMGRIASGVEKETMEEVAQKGYRKVLSTKYFNKKLPEVLQQRIEGNIENLHSAAGQRYDELTEPLKQIPFDLAGLRGKVAKIATRVKLNPFKTDVSNLDEAILDGVMNKAQVKTLGGALDMRRSLDDVIYSNKGELKSSFGKQVRDLLNKELHKVAELKKVDADWAGLQDVLRNSRKIIGETGAKFLSRINTLTNKQKGMLVELEKIIGGEPFMEDLTNWGLAKQLETPPLYLSFGGALRTATRPAFRGYLRTGEAIEQATQPIRQQVSSGYPIRQIGLIEALKKISNGER